MSIHPTMFSFQTADRLFEQNIEYVTMPWFESSSCSCCAADRVHPGLDITHLNGEGENLFKLFNGSELQCEK